MASIAASLAARPNGKNSMALHAGFIKVGAIEPASPSFPIIPTHSRIRRLMHPPRMGRAPSIRDPIADMQADERAYGRRGESLQIFHRNPFRKIDLQTDGHSLAEWRVYACSLFFRSYPNIANEARNTAAQQMAVFKPLPMRALPYQSFGYVAILARKNPLHGTCLGHA